MNWNKYQEAIFEHIASNSGHLVVRARAGTGKTTMLLEALNRLPQGGFGNRTLLCAFNKSIERELKARAPRSVEVRTLHGFGFAALRNEFGSLEVDEDKTHQAVAAAVRGKHQQCHTREARQALRRLISLAKNTHTPFDDQRELEQLAMDHDLDDEAVSATALAEAAKDILCQQADEDPIKKIDFDDMLWLPWVCDLDTRTFDNVFVDELQDISASQEWLIRRALAPGARFVGVGDEKQAVYSWRGAGTDVIPRLTKEFSATVLPMPITYRCARAIVRRAQRIVPDLEAAPNAEEGSVREVRSSDVFQAQPGEFILSRLNAPLLHLCLVLLRQGKAATVAGSGFDKSLAALASKSRAYSVDELRKWLRQYTEQEKQRLMPDYPEKFERLQDKCECLEILCEGEHVVSGVLGRIRRLFQDKIPQRMVICSSVHRAKGLERPRVWMLDNFLKNGNPEERNLEYVAITRAQKELCIVPWERG